MSDLHSRVQQAIDPLVESGVETGVPVAVYPRGGFIVDAVAGHAEAKPGRAVTPHTLLSSAATGKSMTSTVAHVLVERVCSTTTSRSSSRGKGAEPVMAPPFVIGMAGVFATTMDCLRA